MKLILFECAKKIGSMEFKQNLFVNVNEILFIRERHKFEYDNTHSEIPLKEDWNYVITLTNGFRLFVVELPKEIDTYVYMLETKDPKGMLN